MRLSIFMTVYTNLFFIFAIAFHFTTIFIRLSQKSLCYYPIIWKFTQTLFIFEIAFHFTTMFLSQGALDVRKDHPHISGRIPNPDSNSDPNQLRVHLLSWQGGSTPHTWRGIASTRTSVSGTMFVCFICGNVLSKCLCHVAGRIKFEGMKQSGVVKFCPLCS
jgi:hypothetical protein